MAEHDQDHDLDHEQEQEPAKVATPEQRLWVGISLALCVACLCGAFYLDIVHGSTQWQATFVLGFVGYLFTAGVIGSQGDAFVEPDEEPETK